MPSNITPSKPDRLKFVPQKPAEFACPHKPVSGDLATTIYLPVLGERVPVNGPVMNTSLFSGPSGSIPFLTSSKRYLVASPLPPKNIFKVFSLGNSSVILDVDRLTLRTFPMYPNIIDTLRACRNQKAVKTLFYLFVLAEQNPVF